MEPALHPKPFLRWVGSKRRLIDQIAPLLPASFGTYFEPFLGAGSVFLHLAPNRAVLSDACAPLVETWEQVLANPREVAAAAQQWKLDRETYYVVRAMRPSDPLERAARFIYLNKGAFNGLYRENLRGEFNVPWGRPKTDFICDEDALVAVSKALRDASVRFDSIDFAGHLEGIGPGDFVFADPPYVTGHNDNGFIEYNAKIFGWDDQVRLAEFARELVDRGAMVAVTNANHASIRELYSFLELHVVSRSSTLAASRNRRGRVTELVMTGGYSIGQRTAGCLSE